MDKPRPVTSDEMAKNILKAMGIDPTMVMSLFFSLSPGDVATVTIERVVLEDEAANIAEIFKATGWKKLEEA